MHQHTDAERSCPSDIELACTDKRNIAEPNVASSRSREHRMDVVGRREEHANDVVVIDAVALDHLFKQRDRAGSNIVDGVGINGGGAAKRSDNRSHGEILERSGQRAEGDSFERATAARSRERSSSLVSGRHCPGLSFRSARGPMRVRIRRFTGCSMASHMRRI